APTRVQRRPCPVVHWPGRCRGAVLVAQGTLFPKMALASISSAGIVVEVSDSPRLANMTSRYTPHLSHNTCNERGHGSGICDGGVSFLTSGTSPSPHNHRTNLGLRAMEREGHRIEIDT